MRSTNNYFQECQKQFGKHTPGCTVQYLTSSYILHMLSGTHIYVVSLLSAHPAGIPIMHCRHSVIICLLWIGSHYFSSIFTYYL